MTDVKTAKNRKQLLIIFGIAAISTFIPYLMFLTGWGVPSDTKNNGVLIKNPESLAEYVLEDMAGTPWKLGEQEPKFRLVYLLDSECDEQCHESLFLSRQVHIRLARESDQLQRLLVFLNYEPSAEFLAQLAEEHPRLMLLRGDKASWLSMLAKHPELSAEAKGHEYYLMHRYHALVMGYTSEQTGNQLLADLKFLIKTSN